MRQTKIFLLLFLFSNLSFGQRSTSDVEFQEYYNLLKQKKVDTVIVYRWGCVGCDRKYDSSSKSTAKGEFIYVLTTHNGISAIATFDHYSISQDTVDASSVFKAIKRNRKILLLKKSSKDYSVKTDAESSKRKLPFIFEKFEVHLPGTKFKTEFVFDENDRLEAASIVAKKQLKATQKIAEIFLRCLPILPVE